METWWPAPAKLNLFLHLTGRRADGYHELQTLFQFLDFGDSLKFEWREGAEIRLMDSLDNVEQQNNLIFRAARLLQTTCNIHSGVDIYLKKRLPMGGGLGGGSSDAATTLVVLNSLWQCGLNKQQLAALGLQLGADVPVFIGGHAAWAEGVGEKLTVAFPPEPWYLVVKPDCHVSTAEIFSSGELTRDCEAITISRFLSGEGRNVCEPVVCKRHPEVAQALDWLAQYGPARMTGTGACVFVSFSSHAQAQGVADVLPDDWQAFVAKGCNVSPLKASVMKLTESAIS